MSSMEFPILEIITILSLVLSAGFIIYHIYLRTILRKRVTELQQTKVNLEATNKELAKIKTEAKQYSDFQTDFHMAELTTKLKKTRLSTAHNSDFCEPPEKYQYIHSLTQKGLSSEDIASILSISTQEAEQLVNLANLRSKV